MILSNHSLIFVPLTPKESLEHILWQVNLWRRKWIKIIVIVVLVIIMEESIGQRRHFQSFFKKMYIIACFLIYMHPILLLVLSRHTAQNRREGKHIRPTSLLNQREERGVRKVLRIFLIERRDILFVGLSFMNWERIRDREGLVR